MKSNKFHISISNNNPNKIINIELEHDLDTIWIKTPDGWLHGTTLYEIIRLLKEDFENERLLGNVTDHTL